MRVQMMVSNAVICCSRVRDRMPSIHWWDIIGLKAGRDNYPVFYWKMLYMRMRRRQILSRRLRKLFIGTLSLSTLVCNHVVILFRVVACMEHLIVIIPLHLGRNSRIPFMKKLSCSILLCNHISTLVILAGHIPGFIVMSVGRSSMEIAAVAVAVVIDVVIAVRMPIAVADRLLDPE
ncbi:hypothetical protein I7I50_06109 [Histoplasma capsulatum G186AR]|uniref:Uncharacterized protein n=1 Tax=Ajellomyces capsulatus TaxID=5037 RepID=A0A8H8D2L6_AJECA|nr:hypothetical protein I7I52_08847 [Histoplasma capsulatum]QSS67117.1 hypothetical protein I7I50_06109 [Histoplasma capsulatum G186AR]